MDTHLVVCKVKKIRRTFYDNEWLFVVEDKAAFGLTPGEYKNLKGLERENLRDHMNDLSMYGVKTLQHCCDW